MLQLHGHTHLLQVSNTKSDAPLVGLTQVHRIQIPQFGKNMNSIWIIYCNATWAARRKRGLNGGIQTIRSKTQWSGWDPRTSTAKLIHQLSLCVRLYAQGQVNLLSSGGTNYSCLYFLNVVICERIFRVFCRLFCIVNIIISYNFLESDWSINSPINH